ncbi:hypothetical protein [Halobacillus kuroshimensis]|uniref:hypothetical protein n=1 Tax=Halobacillus kuroshimensis TaxID=302481 RepID=UPI00042A146F|nr:hypothetical protein [Halobacillus kuroshimensis]
MSEKEKLEEIERLYAVEERQSVILKKLTGQGLYEPVETTEEGGASYRFRPSPTA